MFTHKQIWQGLDSLAESHGYSPSGLAKRAGLDPTSFNKSKRHSPDGKPRWPSTESLAKVLSVTGATLSDFIGLLEADDSPQKLSSTALKDISSETAKILISTKSVLFNAKEPFTLKSGKKSPVYVDMRRLISFVEERTRLMDFAVRVIRSQVGLNNIDIVAGGETAGIPYGAMIAQRLEKPMIYVRKQPKGYGRMAQIEGVLPKKGAGGGKPRVLLVEDLQTDGSSKQVFIDALRDAGAEVKHAFVLFHYGIFPESLANMKEMGVTLHTLATWREVVAIAKENDFFDAEDFSSIKAFLDHPERWQKKHS